MGTVIDASEVASCGDIMDSDGVGPIVPGDHWTPALASNYVSSGWGGGLLIVSNNTGDHGCQVHLYHLSLDNPHHQLNK